jgi:sRNA-binding protein
MVDMNAPANPVTPQRAKHYRRRPPPPFLPDVGKWIKVLADKYPVFTQSRHRPHRPLMVGAGHQIEADGTIPSEFISSTLHTYCRRNAYLQALAAGGERYDLQGNPVGLVTENERAHAVRLLEEKHVKWELRRAERSGEPNSLEANKKRNERKLETRNDDCESALVPDDQSRPKSSDSNTSAEFGAEFERVLSPDITPEESVAPLHGPIDHGPTPPTPKKGLSLADLRRLAQERKIREAML